MIHHYRGDWKSDTSMKSRAAAGAGAESSDITLAEGQAALDGATRKTLCCASSETSLLGCFPGEGDI